MDLVCYERLRCEDVKQCSFCLTTRKRPLRLHLQRKTFWRCRQTLRQDVSSLYSFPSNMRSLRSLVLLNKIDIVRNCSHSHRGMTRVCIVDGDMQLEIVRVESNFAKFLDCLQQMQWQTLICHIEAQGLRQVVVWEERNE